MTADTSKRDAELERRLSAANDRIKSLEVDRDYYRDQYLALEERIHTLEGNLAAQRDAYEELDALCFRINDERVIFRALVEEFVFFAGKVVKDYIARCRAALKRFTAPQENA